MLNLLSCLVLHEYFEELIYPAWLIFQLDEIPGPIPFSYECTDTKQISTTCSLGTKINHYGQAAVSNEIKPTWQHEWILLIAKNISQAAWRSLAAALFVMAGCQIQLQRRQEILFCNLHLCDCIRLSTIEVAKIKCCCLNAVGSSPSVLQIRPKAF